MWFNNWLWILNFCFCVFTSRFGFADFAYDAFSNHDSVNCSEVRSVKWSVIRLWKLWFAILVNFTPIFNMNTLDNARISELGPDCKIFVAYDFPKNWLNIIHQPSTIFHILRPKSADQTFLSPSGLKQRQS